MPADTILKSRDFTITVASSTTLSDELVIGGSIIGFEMPATWTAANLQLKERHRKLDQTEGSLLDVYGADGVQKLITVAASQFVRVNPADYIGVWKLQLVSTIAQGADRVIRVWFREFA